MWTVALVGSGGGGDSVLGISASGASETELPASTLKRLGMEIWETEGFRRLLRIDNSHRFTIFLTHPGSFGPIFGRLVGDPST